MQRKTTIKARVRNMLREWLFPEVCEAERARRATSDAPVRSSKAKVIEQEIVIHFDTTAAQAALTKTRGQIEAAIRRAKKLEGMV